MTTNATSRVWNSATRNVAILVLSLMAVTAAGSGISCARRCRCVEEGSIVLCQSASLVHIPPLHPSTVVVDLDHNHISMLMNNSLSVSPLLDILSMEDNGLMYIDPNIFTLHTQLRILRLGHNQLTHLPEKLFQNAHRLEILDLHENRFAGSIPHTLLMPLHSLQVLNFSLNELTSPLLGDGFRYATQLRDLDLSHNYFSSLEPDTFRASRSWDNSVTHYVNLSYSNIRHIHPRALSRMVRIQGISLAGNRHIPHDELQAALGDLEVSSLESLDLSGLNLSSILTFFSSFHHNQLTSLFLSLNSITQIPARSFLYLINLHSLDLSFNSITSIADLTGLSRLENLNLAHNQISTLHETTFEGLHEIQSLDISHNFLNNVEGSTFLDLFNLQTLDISHNMISDISISSGLETLQVIRATGNLIMEASFLRRLPHLRIADLSNNIIRKLNPGQFSLSQDLVLLNFSANALYELNSSVFENASPREIDLSHNRLRFLPYPGWQRVRKLHLNDNRLENVTANAFQGLVTLEALYMQENNLHTFDEVVFDDLVHLKYLDLSNNPLASYLQSQRGIDLMNEVASLEILHLSSVDLRHLPSDMLAALTSLRRLNLSRNSLEGLDDSCLASLPQLTFLDLSHNLLTTPQPRHFVGNSLTGLDFSDNPLRCTCDTEPLISWLQLTNISIANIEEASLYQCVSPSQWKGIALLDFHLDDTSCSFHEKAIIFIAIGCTVMALVLLVTLAVFRYKWWYRRKQAQTRYSFIDDTLTSGTGSFSMNGSATSNESNTVQVNRHSREWV